MTNIRPLIFFIFLFSILCFGVWNSVYAQEDKAAEQRPIVVNGDKVEYSAESKMISASGNVEVIYKTSRLTCQKLSINSQTKDAVAEGDARLEEPEGIIEGTKIIYNFQTKTGVMIEPNFKANPYFGRAKELEKVSASEFIARRGYVTTCSLDHPHYRIKSKSTTIFPDDKIQTKNDTFLLGDVPVMYLPFYNHSLKDPMMHVQFMPGKSKEWGPYLLTAWRYNLTENLSGRIYFDARERLGVAEGLGSNYTTEGYGKGDFKYYYTQERSKRFDEGIPAEFERYLIRWRHKWDINEKTTLTSEYYKIVDSKRQVLGTEYNILKDYFYREYETESQPLSYVLIHNASSYANTDIIVQKRTNRWYSQLEKLPEVTFTLPSMGIGDTGFYFENTTQAAQFNDKNAVPSPAEDDVNVTRIDMNNQLSLPVKIAFVNFKPFVDLRETYYNTDINGSSISLRTHFRTGADISTKFYRFFDIDSNILGLNINKIRHIITPTMAYVYAHDPTIPNTKLKQIDSIDALTRSHSATLELSNKFQTKRGEGSVDIADFRLSSIYTFKPKTGAIRGSRFGDIVFNMELRPYSWLRVDFDTTYKNSGSRSDENYRKFSTINYDVNFDFGTEQTIGIGQRYARKGGNELIYDINWRFNPKWRFSVYQRFEIGDASSLKTGLREQEYLLARDFHCWTTEFTYRVKRDEGEGVYLVFRLKAFPELEFEYNQSYHRPKPGAQ